MIELEAPGSTFAIGDTAFNVYGSDHFDGALPPDIKRSEIQLGEKIAEGEYGASDHPPIF